MTQACKPSRDEAHVRLIQLSAGKKRWDLVEMLKEFGGVAQLDGGALGEMGARFARSSRDTPADQQARRHHLAVGIFDKQACAHGYTSMTVPGSMVRVCTQVWGYQRLHVRLASVASTQAHEPVAA